MGPREVTVGESAKKEKLVAEVRDLIRSKIRSRRCIVYSTESTTVIGAPHTNYVLLTKRGVMEGEASGDDESDNISYLLSETEFLQRWEWIQEEKLKEYIDFLSEL